MYLLSSVSSGHVLHPVLSAVELQLHHHQSLCIKVRQDGRSWHVALLLVFFSSFTLVTDSTTFSAYLEVRAVHELHYLRLLLALQQVVVQVQQWGPSDINLRAERPSRVELCKYLRKTKNLLSLAPFSVSSGPVLSPMVPTVELQLHYQQSSQ